MQQIRDCFIWRKKEIFLERRLLSWMRISRNWRKNIPKLKYSCLKLSRNVIIIEKLSMICKPEYTSLPMRTSKYKKWRIKAKIISQLLCTRQSPQQKDSPLTDKSKTDTVLIKQVREQMQRQIHKCNQTHRKY